MKKQITLISEIHCVGSQITHSLWWYDGDILEVAGDDLYHYEVAGCKKVLDRVGGDALETAILEIQKMLESSGVEVIVDYSSDD